MKTPILPATLAFGLALAALPAQAQTLKMGFSAEPTAVDPHYQEIAPNTSLAQHLYSYLVGVDANMNPEPQLAESWQAEGERSWLFTLRKGVKFSNGAEFTAQDVIYSLCRIVNNPTNAANAYAAYGRGIEAIEVLDPYRLRITNSSLQPLFPELLANVAMLSASTIAHDEIRYDLANNCGVTEPWPTAEGFNSGALAIGTGPFVLKSFVRGTGIELARNPDYWGPAPEWDTVQIRPVAAAGPRLAGLLAGDYDFIESPAGRDIAKLGDGFGYAAKPSHRLIFLQPDYKHDPDARFGTEGGKNPFKDIRVRQALSLAIDRDAIVARVMDGFAVATSQWVPEEMFGALQDAPKAEFDPERAKTLMAEAGYPYGFSITLGASNDRYMNDGQIAQAVAQYLTRIGIRTEVDAMTASMFFSRRSAQEFAISLGGWGSSAGGSASFLRQFAMTRDREAGVGASNHGEWSDPVMDATMREVLRTVDLDQRRQLTEEATRRAMDEQGFIPLHLETSLWAFRKGLAYEGRMDQYTRAQDIRSAE